MKVNKKPKILENGYKAENWFEADYMYKYFKASD